MVLNSVADNNATLDLNLLDEGELVFIVGIHGCASTGGCHLVI